MGIENMKKSYADYAVYEGVAYRRVSYVDRVELFDVNDENCEHVLLSVPKDKIEDSYSVFNKAVLNGVEYVVYDIKEGQVYYGTTHKDSKILQRKIEDFDLVFQTIPRGPDKPVEKKLIYSKDTGNSSESQIKKYYPEEMANGSIMFSVCSDQISKEEIVKAIRSLYKDRVSEAFGFTRVIYVDMGMIRIDGNVLNITEDLDYGIITISPLEKGKGEKYIFEIADYFNQA